MSKIQECVDIMRRVYGKFTTAGKWKPNPLKEGSTRYLWTDAYAVCNFLSLYCETKQEEFLHQAKLLIDDVHDTLGKDRQLKKRLGKATAEHPCLGGLRIGKGEDEDETMQGDGQYYHYLTKWMFALNRMSAVTKDTKYNQWAIELAESVHDNFVFKLSSSRKYRMVWKISIDMESVLVNSEGNLDPYDGYVTYQLLRETAGDAAILERQTSELKEIVSQKYKQYSSTDPLDLGECLWITSWRPSSTFDDAWGTTLLRKSLSSLDKIWELGYFERPLRGRLLFREMGTTIGTQLVMGQVTETAGARNVDESIRIMALKWKPRVEAIHSQWKENVFSRDHDISPVMYVSSLLSTNSVLSKGYSGISQVHQGEEKIG